MGLFCRRRKETPYPVAPFCLCGKPDKKTAWLKQKGLKIKVKNCYNKVSSILGQLAQW